LNAAPQRRFRSLRMSFTGSRSTAAAMSSELVDAGDLHAGRQ
jgi:hypothetical protein